MMLQSVHLLWSGFVSNCWHSFSTDSPVILVFSVINEVLSDVITSCPSHFSITRQTMLYCAATHYVSYATNDMTVNVTNLLQYWFRDFLLAFATAPQCVERPRMTTSLLCQLTEVAMLWSLKLVQVVERYWVVTAVLRGMNRRSLLLSLKHCYH